VAGFTLQDFKRNTELWNYLNIYDMNEEIENQRRKWYDHILRMDDSRLPVLLNYKPEGKKRNTQGKMER
jgi:hypothetical protein